MNLILNAYFDAKNKAFRAQKLIDENADPHELHKNTRLFFAENLGVPNITPAIHHLFDECTSKDKKLRSLRV